MDQLINFDDLKPGAGALKKLVQAFTRAGAPVATSDIDPRTRRTLGMNYRQVDLSMTDNQKVSLGVKTSGDIYEVRVNGQVLPITAQSDQRKAVAEIVKALDAGRAKFQAKLARQRVALPKGITTAAPKMEQKLAQASADLDTQIATAKVRVNELRAELGEPVLDAVGGLKPGIYVRFKDGSEPVFLGASLSAAKAKYEQWGNRGKGAKLLDKEHETRKTLHWVERSYGLDVEGREAWANMDLTDSMLDSAGAGAVVLDATIPQASELSSAAQEVLGQIDKAGPVFDGDLVSKSGRDELVERGLVERVDGDNILTAKGKGCAATLDSTGGFPRLEADGKRYARDQYRYVDTDEHGELPATLVLKDDASPILDAVDVPTNSFDNPDVLAAQQIAQQVNSGAALDGAAFEHALATLYIALDTVETNHPINLAEGNLEQAELEERAAEDFRAAIKVLEGLQAAS